MKINYDLQSLTDVDLLAVTLCESPSSSAITGLLNKINTMDELLQITMQELEEVEGIKPQSAEQFLAGLELTKRIYAAPSRVDLPSICCCILNAPDEIFRSGNL